jgi:hypothetical protein
MSGAARASAAARGRIPGGVLVSSCALVLAACVSRAPGLEEIVARNRAVVNGGTNTALIGSLEVDLRLKDAKAGSELRAIYRVNRSGQMRIDLYQGGERVYTEAFDGQRGWDLGAEGSAAIPDPHAQALWHGTQFPGMIFGLEDLAPNGHRLEYAGRERLGGVDYYVLKITLSDGFVTYRYVNPATWLIDRGRDFRAFHPALDAHQTWIETVYSDYRRVDGVMRSFVSTNTDLGTGAWQATNTIEAIKVNPSFDPAIFRMPAVTP